MMSGTASFDRKFISHEINRHLRSENNLDIARKISLVLEVCSTHNKIEKSARIQFIHSSMFRLFKTSPDEFCCRGIRPFRSILMHDNPAHQQLMTGNQRWGDVLPIPATNSY